MSRLDLVIFGATGFTGTQAAIQMVPFAKKYGISSWGIAGRNESKLKAVLAEVAKKVPDADLSSVKIIIADVSDEKSLKQMCEQTKVVVNCCGPYRLYGEPVVKAAIESKTHYVDVSGEPQFMELMQIRYNSLAKEAGVFVISACGWDSVPADMAVCLIKQNFDGTLNSVQEYLSYRLPKEYQEMSKERGVINYGTWESLVYGIAYYKDLPKLRKQLYPDRMAAFKPKLSRQIIHKRDNKWYLPFLGSDESVVYRTQRHFYDTLKERPVQCKAYVRSAGYWQSLVAVLTAIVFYVLTQTKFTRSLLLKYPKFFSRGMVSRQGPEEQVMNNTHFKFRFEGEGWAQGADESEQPDKRIVAEVSGTNPGYGATVLCVLSSALTILKERHNMPNEGGVVTTGIAFRDTGLIKVLNESEFIKFEIV